MSQPKPRLKVSSVAAVLLSAAGLGCFDYGCWQIYHPLGWIIGGLLITVIFLYIARETLETNEPR